jgi:hypothetical protein|tara:strand:- start:853 stop:1008 length:156 start_codon:yes stop_codon:yes gene_type:complete
MNDVITVETEHFVVEMDQESYDSVKFLCEKFGITEDYYFHEFQEFLPGDLE